MATEPDDDKLLVATHGAWTFVRVVGRGSFKVSAALKRFHAAMMERGYLRHALDMTECSGLDSTFMGVLAGLALRLKKRDGDLVMLNVSPKISNLLDVLGLIYLIDAYPPGEIPDGLKLTETGAAEMSELDISSEDKRQTTLVMLDAHQSLIDASPENLPKFKDVLAYLREDLHEKEDLPSGAPGPDD